MKVFLLILFFIFFVNGFCGLTKFSSNLSNNKVKVLISCSPPGCGKTIEVVKFIKDSLRDDRFKNVIIIKKFLYERNINELSIYEKLCEIYKKEELDYMIKGNILKVKVMKDLYGYDFKKSIILLEDANRYTLDEIKLLMTRINDDCKLVITDSEDSIKIKNLIRKVNNFRLKCHLNYKLNNIEFEDNIKGVEMIESDILRSNITCKVLEIFK